MTSTAYPTTAKIAPMLIQRGRKYSLVLRVPARYASVEKRKKVFVALKTSDPSEARRLAPAAEADLLATWEAALAAKQAETPTDRFARAVELAKRHRIRYMPVDELAAGSLDRILEHVQALGAIRNPTPEQTAALLGAVEKPQFMVSDLLELYEKHTKLEHRDKNDRQMHLWRLPRKRAIANWVEAVGDKPIHEVSRSDVLDFRHWQIERVTEDGIAPSTANKDMTHLAGMLSSILNAHKLPNLEVFAGLYLKAGEQEERVPFSSEWIRQNILAPGALPGLNDQARDILIIMQGTGCRPSEIIGLHPEDIHLTHNIPHFSITRLGKAVKTKDSLRDVPLTGAALEAMRRNPEGFPRYRGRTTGWSNAVNQYLRGRGLMSDRQSAYSLRHSFADRLTNLDPPVKESRQYWDMMGQAVQGIRYGSGTSLELKAEITRRVELG